jgi:hypothetical protein
VVVALGFAGAKLRLRLAAPSASIAGLIRMFGGAR